MLIYEGVMKQQSAGFRAINADRRKANYRLDQLAKEIADLEGIDQSFKDLICKHKEDFRWILDAVNNGNTLNNLTLDVLINDVNLEVNLQPILKNKEAFVTYWKSGILTSEVCRSLQANNLSVILKNSDKIEMLRALGIKSESIIKIGQKNENALQVFFNNFHAIITLLQTRKENGEPYIRFKFLESNFHDASLPIWKTLLANYTTAIDYVQNQAKYFPSLHANGKQELNLEYIIQIGQQCHNLMAQLLHNKSAVLLFDRANLIPICNFTNYNKKEQLVVACLLQYSESTAFYIDGNFNTLKTDIKPIDRLIEFGKSDLNKLEFLLQNRFLIIQAMQEYKKLQLSDIFYMKEADARQLLGMDKVNIESQIGALIMLQAKTEQLVERAERIERAEGNIVCV